MSLTAPSLLAAGLACSSLSSVHAALASTMNPLQRELWARQQEQIQLDLAMRVSRQTEMVEERERVERERRARASSGANASQSRASSSANAPFANAPPRGPPSGVQIVLDGAIQRGAPSSSSDPIVVDGAHRSNAHRGNVPRSNDPRGKSAASAIQLEEDEDEIQVVGRIKRQRSAGNAPAAATTTPAPAPAVVAQAVAASSSGVPPAAAKEAPNEEAPNEEAPNEEAKERSDLGRIIVAFTAHLHVLRNEASILGAPAWSISAERGLEFDAWKDACLAIKTRSGKACLRTRLLAESKLRFKDEPVEDAGGASIEFFSNLFSSAFEHVACIGEAPASHPQYPLLERGGSDGKLLPYLPALKNSGWSESFEGQRHHERLRLLGAALLKCLIEGYAIGPELARFAFDHLMEDHRPFHMGGATDADGAFSSPTEAFHALCDFAPNAKSLWGLRHPSSLGVAQPLDTYVDAGLLPASDADEEVTLNSASEVDAFIIRCARYTLLDSRRAALASFRDGFHLSVGQGERLDISAHLALFTPSEAAAFIGGKQALRSDELVKMISWPNAGDACKMWGSGYEPHKLLRRWIEEQTDERCTAFFRCVTARAAVPDPRREPVTIKLEALTLENGHLAGPGARPQAYTCFNTFYLPGYEQLEQLEVGLRDLLATKSFTTR